MKASLPLSAACWVSPFTWSVRLSALSRRFPVIRPVSFLVSPWPPGLVPEFLEDAHAAFPFPGGSVCCAASSAQVMNVRRTVIFAGGKDGGKREDDEDNGCADTDPRGLAPLSSHRLAGLGRSGG